MALSNWDTLAFDTNGQPCNGIFKRDNDWIEIYKNWLYIHSDMWKDGKGYVENTIAQFNSGSISICGFNISAVRGKQSSIYVYASIGYGKDQKFFGGIGAYGYKDKVLEVLTKLGREQDYNKRDWFEGSDCHTRFIQHFSENGLGEKIIFHIDSIDGEYNYAADWIGIMSNTVQDFVTWLENREDIRYNRHLAEWINKIKSTEPLRFNQGDAFFSDYLQEKIPASEPGEAQPTMLSKIIKHMK